MEEGNTFTVKRVALFDKKVTICFIIFNTKIKYLLNMPRKVKSKSYPSMIIKMSNDILDARFNLTSNEIKILTYCIHKLRVDEEGKVISPFVYLSFDEIQNNIGIDCTNGNQIIENGRRVWNLKLYKQNEKGLEVEFINFFRRGKKLEGKQEFKIEFDEYIYPYINKLTKNFTSLELNEVFTLDSKHSTRLYSLLVRYYGLQKKYGTKWVCDIKDFCWLFNIKSDALKGYKMINCRIIKPSQKEISKKTSYSFSYTPIRQGTSKVVAIEFDIKKVIQNGSEDSKDSKYKKVMSENNQPALDKHTCDTKIKEERKAGKVGNHYVLRRDFVNDEEFHKYVLTLKKEGFQNIIFPAKADEEIFRRMDEQKTII